MEHEAALLNTVRLQGVGMRALRSPFYEALCERLAVDVEEDGPVARVLAPFAAAPFEAAYVLRLLGGVHRLVLAGEAPALARHYPSVDGDGDADAAWRSVSELLTEPPAAVLDALTRPPQTNEVGRSVALASGMLQVAREVRRPLSLRELGSSGGLNLRLDSYWYEQDGAGFGDPSSAVRFVGLWDGAGPPFEPGFAVADRRGCDRDPIDAASDEGALTLLSYVWPEPAERFRRARAALAQAHHHPVTIDRADIDRWVAAQVPERRAGTALVVFHSVVWQYLDDATRAAVREHLEAAGRAATPDTPVAWLRLEPHPETYAPAELRLTLWAGGGADAPERLLATTGFHGGPIRWLGGAPGPA